MPLTAPEWDAIEPVFHRKDIWLLVPDKDAYAPLFEGSLSEAVAKAADRAAYWQSAYTVYHAPKGRPPAKIVPVIKISLPKDSPLKVGR